MSVEKEELQNAIGMQEELFNASDVNALEDLGQKFKDQANEVLETKEIESAETEETDFASINQFGIAKTGEVETPIFNTDEEMDGVKKDENGNVVKIDFTKLDVEQVINAEVKVLTYNPNLIEERLADISEVLAKEEITEKKDKDLIYRVRMDFRNARLDLKKETDHSIAKYDGIRRGVKARSEAIQSLLSEEEAKLVLRENQYEEFKTAESRKKEEDRQAKLRERVNELTEAGIYFDTESESYVCGLVNIDIITIEKNSDKKHAELVEKVKEQSIAEEEKQQAVEAERKRLEAEKEEADRKAKEEQEKANKEAEEAKKAVMQMRSMLMLSNGLQESEGNFFYNGNLVVSVQDVSNYTNEEFMNFVNGWMAKKLELDKEREENLKRIAKENETQRRVSMFIAQGFIGDASLLVYKLKYGEVTASALVEEDNEMVFSDYFDSKINECKDLINRQSNINYNIEFLKDLGFEGVEGEFSFESGFDHGAILITWDEVENSGELFTEEKKTSINLEVNRIKGADKDKSERIAKEAEIEAKKHAETLVKDLESFRLYLEKLKEVEKPEFKTEGIKTFVDSFFADSENILKQVEN